jgi:hypothetical protein
VTRCGHCDAMRKAGLKDGHTWFVSHASSVHNLALSRSLIEARRKRFQRHMDLLEEDFALRQAA